MSTWHCRVIADYLRRNQNEAFKSKEAKTKWVEGIVFKFML